MDTLWHPTSVVPYLCPYGICIAFPLLAFYTFVLIGLVLQEGRWARVGCGGVQRRFFRCVYSRCLLELVASGVLLVGFTGITMSIFSSFVISHILLVVAPRSGLLWPGVVGLG